MDSCSDVRTQDEVVCDACHASKSQNQKKFQEAVNNCARSLVVLGFVCLLHLSFVPCPFRGFSHMVSSC